MSRARRLPEKRNRNSGKPQVPPQETQSHTDDGLLINHKSLINRQFFSCYRCLFRYSYDLPAKVRQRAEQGRKYNYRPALKLSEKHSIGGQAESVSTLSVEHRCNRRPRAPRDRTGATDGHRRFHRPAKACMHATPSFRQPDSQAFLLWSSMPSHGGMKLTNRLIFIEKPQLSSTLLSLERMNEY